MSTSVDYVCRLCVVEGEAGSDSLKLLNPNEELLEIIHALTTVEIIPDADQQYFICTTCRQSVLNFNSFREQCIANDQLFRHRLLEISEFKDVAPTDEEEVVVEEEEMAKEEVIEQLPSESTIGEDEASLNAETYTMQEAMPTEMVEEVLITPFVSVPEMESDASDTFSKDAKPTRGRRKTGNAKSKDSHSNKLPCVQCGKMIARNNMKQHLLVHDPDRPKVFCTYCGKAFREQGRLQLHINSNHTLENKYPCEICGKIYLRPTSLRDHITAKHTQDKQYPCGECDLVFNSWAKRWHHFKKEHTTAKPFACTYCDWAFKFKGDLTLHIRKHTGEKPFKCDICGKAFNKSYNVVIHKKSHRNKEPPAEGTS
ncbi:endothelial zinc finger protein induced by tumor necrosis factor alpha-like [Anopheles darlingi]|uniref:endothelial zinc finger protein induced by tumor necrosis factor alpha-like n=1 Tax=Anopheles darlingi TaxID=43151 RepID=UPI002100647C|nr:endothelial zinc finger protein induced by tumor necrosis factor alpha-like [Anopheles darlingi]